MKSNLKEDREHLQIEKKTGKIETKLLYKNLFISIEFLYNFISYLMVKKYSLYYGPIHVDVLLI